MAIVGSVVPSDQPLVVEHIATHARRYYGDPGREVIEVPSAWTNTERPLAVRQTLLDLATTESSDVWLLATQVGRTGAGKSTIIQKLTGHTDAEIGNGYMPCTKDSRYFDYPQHRPILRFLVQKW